MNTIIETSFEIKGDVRCKGTWEKVSIVRESKYSDGSTDRSEILTFGKHFNDAKEAEKFMSGKLFKSCLKAAIKENQ